MAKSKSTSNSISAHGSTPSLATLLTYKLRPAPLLLPTPFTAATLAETGDRRRFQPDRSIAPPGALRRYAAKVTAPKYGRLSSLRFADPKLVALCARRKRRREVIFALAKNKAGSGAKKRKNFWSHISC